MKYKTAMYLAAKEGFIDFLSNSLDNNEKDKVQEWIGEVLLKQNTNLNYETKVGFFEAEKHLITHYLETNNIDKIKQLFEVFNSFTNEGFNRIEFKMFADLLNEKKDLLTIHPEDQLSLKEILNSTFSKLTHDSASELIGVYHDTLSLLGQDNGSGDS